MATTSAFLFAAATGAVPSLQRTRVLVEAGKPVAVRVLGKPWRQGKTFLESDPTPPARNPQGLYGDCSVGSGDFHIKAKLTLSHLDRSAAAFAFALTDFFGFEGAHNAMFVTGPFFNNARGKKIGDPEAVITPGKPFDFECIRKEDMLYVLIGNTTVYQQKVSVRAMGPPGFRPARSTMRVHSFSVTGNLEPYTEPKPRVRISDVDNITAHPFVTPLPDLMETRYVRLDDGGILTATGYQAFVSYDEGKSYKRFPIFPNGENMTFRKALAVKAPDGTVVLVFANDREFNFSWDRKKNLPNHECRRPVYTVRSRDNGKTWTPPMQLDDTYCGALNDAIVTGRGTIIVTGQELLYQEGRHTTRPYVCTDNGKTWMKADKLDIEMPRGDHSGLIEATLTELRDGRIWILLRSYHGFFYEAFSSDDGRTWTQPKPSTVKSTGSPGILKRLHSGRLMLMWNAIPNEGFKRREELSIAFSDDDAHSWTKPLVILRNPGGRVSYPNVFEPEPGRIWFSVGQGHYRGTFREKDMLKQEAKTAFPHDR